MAGTPWDVPLPSTVTLRLKSHFRLFEH